MIIFGGKRELLSQGPSITNNSIMRLNKGPYLPYYTIGWCLLVFWCLFAIFIVDLFSFLSNLSLRVVALARGFITGFPMEASSSRSSESSEETASKFLSDLPSRGFLSSTVVPSNPVTLLSN